MTLGRWLESNGTPEDEGGVVPDLVLAPVSLSRNGDAAPSKNVALPPASQPAPSLQFLAAPPPSSKIRDDVEDRPDPEIELCAAFLREAASANTRDAQLTALGAFVRERAPFELERLTKALAGQGVDWSASTTARDATEPRLAASIAEPIEAPVGGTMRIVVTIANTGTGAAHRVHAVIQSDDSLFDEREFFFGLIPPGEQRSWTVPIEIPASHAPSRDDLLLRFDEEPQRAPPELHASASILDLPRRDLSAAVHASPEISAAGILWQLDAKVTNSGPAAAPLAYVRLQPSPGSAWSPQRGDPRLGALAPGATASTSFALLVPSESASAAARGLLILGDGESKCCEEIAFALPAGPNPAPTSFTVEPLRINFDADGLREPPGIAANSFLLSGVAQGAASIKDLQLFVEHGGEARKVAFVSSNSADSIGTADLLKFSVNVPLQMGSNTVNVIARTRAGQRVVRSIVVRRIP